MPIFEFQCQECGAVSEYLVLGDSSVETCKACGSGALKKLLSPTAGYSGHATRGLPGKDATGCCGSRAGEAHGCAGPGSCCGKND